MWSDTIMIISKKAKDKIGEYSVYIGIFLIIAFFLLKPVIINMYNQYKNDNETITNKEVQQFHDWESKQNQSKWENEDSK
jgi:membrane protein CcdC involved in cytochrome C biogenesis